MAKPPPRDYVDVVPFTQRIEIAPIGVVRSPHRERHGTPRQAVVHADAEVRPGERATVALFPERIPPEAVRDLAAFSHVWVVAWLHLNQGWNAQVVPPRGPRVPRSTLATRAPHRPNPIGLSAARLLEVDGLELHFERLDLLDGTPVLDVKPYVPYADRITDANDGWLEEVD